MKTTYYAMKLAVTVLALMAVSLSQEPQQPAKATGTTAESHPEMTRLIKAMVGTWSTVVTFERSERYPKGAEERGKQVWRAGPGDLSLIEDETASTPSGPWLGMSVTWWDNEGQGFRAIWCDNRQANGCIVMKKLAGWQGNDFVLGDEWIKNGKKFVYKEVCSDLTPNSFTLTSYTGESGQELKKTMTVRAKRIADSP